MIRVVQPGLSTTVQDAGRDGYYKVGLSPSGALDQDSYAIGNALVGNPAGLAVLEIMYLGPTLQFERAAVIALSGADIPMQVNGEAVPAWAAVAVKQGDQVTFGHLKSGARAYLSVRGGIDVPIDSGSRSTHLVAKIGGFEGRALTAGDVLPVGNCPSVTRSELDRRLPEELRPSYEGTAHLRFIFGLFAYRLTEESKRRFVDTMWKVTTAADRTGFRMSSRDVEPFEFVTREQPFGAGSDPSNVVDAGYPIGSVQIPGGSEPIVLHRDAVTAGGYFTVGAVLSSDLNRLAQCPTGALIQFESIALEDAVDARRAQRALRDRAFEALIG